MIVYLSIDGHLCFQTSGAPWLKLPEQPLNCLRIHQHLNDIHVPAGAVLTDICKLKVYPLVTHSQILQDAFLHMQTFLLIPLVAATKQVVY